MKIHFWGSVAAAQKVAKSDSATDRYQFIPIIVGVLLALLALAGFVSLILSDYH